MREKHTDHPTKAEIAAAFGAALRTRRTASGLTQEALAESAGLTTQYVSMLERGVNQPSLHSVITLAAGLGVEAIELVGGAVLELLRSSESDRRTTGR